MAQPSITDDAEELAWDEAESLSDRGILPKLSVLREKLGQKAKREPEYRLGEHLRRRSQRGYRRPPGESLYGTLTRLGLHRLRWHPVNSS